MREQISIARIGWSLSVLVLALALYLPSVHQLEETTTKTQEISVEQIASTREEAIAKARQQQQQTYTYIAPGMPPIGMQANP